jgi:hypothetical protein
VHHFDLIIIKSILKKKNQALTVAFETFKPK